MDIIIQEWNLDSNLHSREAILAALAQRIDSMLADDPMGFIQLMYRLDIPEGSLDAALNGIDPGIQMAQLIWDRQIQKNILRTMTPPRNNSGDEELNW